MASKLLHLLRVMAILESCRGGGGGHGKMVKTEEGGVGASETGGPAAGGVSSERGRLLSAHHRHHHHQHRDMISINMFKVYERYSKEPHRVGQKDGNTVRSFKAVAGTSEEGRELFRFNLSSVPESEHVLSASFHFLYKRPRHPHHHHHHHPRGPSWPCRRAHNNSPVVSCGGVEPAASSRPPQLLFFRGGGGGAGGVNVTLSPPKRGSSWQAVDVTALVRRAARAAAGEQPAPLLAAEFDFGAARSQEPQKQQAIKAHHHHHAGGGHHAEQQQRPASAPATGLPYLLVYADDRAIDEPNSVAASLQRYGPSSSSPTVGGEEEERRARSAANANAAAPAAPAAPASARARRDLDRQIQTNDLPEVHFSSLKNHELWQSTYFPPKAPKASAASAVKHGRKAAGQESGGAGTGTGAGGGGGLSKPPPQVLSFDERTMKKARRRQWSEPRVCARRYLRVDFADIGWSEWVLAPKAFDAYYCAGTCGFPIPKVVRPSNHATIQSIVRAVGIVPGVPEPCCVPDKMSPLSVLFLDPERNMVLKVYPGMSVDTCACR